MAVTAENLDILLRVVGLRAFQAQMAEARGAVLGVGKAAAEADAEQASAAEAAAARAAATRRAAMGVAAAIAVVAGEAYKLSIGYQQQIEMVHTQAGLTQADTDKIYRQTLVMSRKFPQGPNEMAKAVYHMASVTHDAATSMVGLKSAAELATIGNSDLEATTSAVAAVWRASRGEGLSFQRIVSLLNATVGAGNMRMNDLVGALGTGVLPVFKTGGVTLEQFGAALALLTDEGQHADNAATHLRMTLTLLAAPSKIAQKELGKIGLGALDLSEKMRSGPSGLIDALELLREKLYMKFPGKPTTVDQANKIMSGLDPAQAGLDAAASERMNILARAFGGARSGATIMALVDQLQSLREKYGQVLDTQSNFGDSLAHTLGLPVTKLHVAWSNLQVDLIEFGDTIRGPVTTALLIIIGTLDVLLKFFNSGPGHVILTWVGLLAAAWVGVRVATLLAAAATRAWAIAMAFVDIVSVIGMVGSLGDAIAAMSLIIEEIPLVAVISLIALALVMLITHWGAVKHAAIDAWHWIEGAGQAAWGGIRTAGNAVMGFFRGVINGIKSIFENVVNFFIDRVNNVISIMNDAIKAYNAIPLVPNIPTIHGLSHIGARGVKESLHIYAHSLGFATGGVMPASGMATINERSQGESIWLPRGATVQPSPADSLMVPRAHTPNPTPRPEPYVIENHLTVELDRRVLYKAVTRASADSKARR